MRPPLPSSAPSVAFRRDLAPNDVQDDLGLGAEAESRARRDGWGWHLGCGIPLFGGRSEADGWGEERLGGLGQVGGRERPRCVSTPGQVEETEEGTSDDVESGASRVGSACASCRPPGSLRASPPPPPWSPRPHSCLSCLDLALSVLTSHLPGLGVPPPRASPRRDQQASRERAGASSAVGVLVRRPRPQSCRDAVLRPCVFRADRGSESERETPSFFPGPF